VRGAGVGAPGILAVDRIEPPPPAETFNVTTFVMGVVAPESLIVMSKRMLRGAAPAAVPTVARGGVGVAGGVG
jgi:hypothetical protein